ncbi:uncharacterized protein MONBRDRAFT_36631 [Monosiga brevicollis MX1]|uniref:Uncharacterized protein n=1 Tax=Monosiga brevicollis TaxID=81824 RepID=A9UWH5_MONBE|nr:uncharacterized protein MONBRDRAFT_36631 [Monosiga brevicollis MX1]EDQ90214.1 predicted protein [Monosiga brevicollis MX1]|eukprot:XP_001744981.1 hypothetical protein [Monosiga brevicollis MX1]
MPKDYGTPPAHKKKPPLLECLQAGEDASSPQATSPQATAPPLAASAVATATTCEVPKPTTIQLEAAAHATQEQEVEFAKSIDAEELATMAAERNAFHDKLLKAFGLRARDPVPCVVYLLGKSGAGKSLCWSHLRGIKIFEEDTELGKHLDVDRNGPEDVQGIVGDGIEAKTIEPRFAWVNDMIVVDPAGFGDTRNKALTITNSIGLRYLLSQTPRKRVLFLINFQNLHGDSSYLDEQFQILERFFPDIKTLDRGVLFLYSRLGDSTASKGILAYLNKFSGRMSVQASEYQQKLIVLMKKQLALFEEKVLLRPHWDNDPEGLIRIISQHIGECDASASATLGSPLKDSEVAEVRVAVGKCLEELIKILTNKEQNFWKGVGTLSTMRILAEQIADEAITERYISGLSQVAALVQRHIQGFVSALRAAEYQEAARQMQLLQKLSCFNPELQQPTVAEQKLCELGNICPELQDLSTQSWDHSRLLQTLKGMVRAVGEALHDRIRKVNEKLPFDADVLPEVPQLIQFDSYLASMCQVKQLWPPLAKQLREHAQEAQRTLGTVVAALKESTQQAGLFDYNQWPALHQALDLHERGCAYSSVSELEVVQTMFENDKQALNAVVEIMCKAILTISNLIADCSADEAQVQRLGRTLNLLQGLEENFASKYLPPGQAPYFQSQKATFEGAIRTGVGRPINDAMAKNNLSAAEKSLQQLSLLVAVFRRNSAVRDVQNQARTLLSQLAALHTESNIILDKIVEGQASQDAFEAMARATQQLVSYRCLDPIIVDGRILQEPSELFEAHEDNATVQMITVLQVATTESVLQRTEQALRESLGSLVSSVCESISTKDPINDFDVQYLCRFHPLQDTLGPEHVELECRRLTTAVDEVDKTLQAFEVVKAPSTTRENDMAWLVRTIAFAEHIRSNCHLFPSQDWSSLLASLEVRRTDLMNQVQAHAQTLLDAVRSATAAGDLGQTRAELAYLQGLNDSCNPDMQKLGQPVYAQAKNAVNRKLEQLVLEHRQNQSSGNLASAQEAKQALLGASVLQEHFSGIDQLLAHLHDDDDRALKEIRSQFDAYLEEANYERAEQLLTELAATHETPEWAACHRSLVQSAVRQLRPTTRDILKQARRMERQVLQSQSHGDKLQGTLLAMDELDERLSRLQVLAPVLPDLQLHDVEAEFSKSIRSIYKRLHQRLWKATTTNQFASAEVLYALLTSWRCRERDDVFDASRLIHDSSLDANNDAANEMPAERKGNLAEVEEYAREIDTTTRQQVEQLVQARVGPKLNRFVKAFERIRAQEYDPDNTLFPNLLALADDVNQWVTQAAAKELDEIETTLFEQGSRLARAKLREFDDFFYNPLQGDGLPPFRSSESALSVQRNQVHGAIQQAQDAEHLELLTPEFARNLAQTFAKDGVHERAEFVSKLRNVCQRGVQELQTRQAEALRDERTGTLFTAAAVGRVLGLLALETELKDKGLDSFLMSLRTRAIVPACDAIVKRADDDLNRFIDMAKDFDVQGVERLFAIFDGNMKRLEESESFDMTLLQDAKQRFAQLKGAVSAETSGAQLGAVDVDQPSLNDILTPGFEAEKLDRRLERLKSMAGSQAEAQQRSQNFFGARSSFDPARTLAAIVAHWRSLTQDLIRVFEQRLSAHDQVDEIAACYSCMGQLKVVADADLVGDFASARRRLDDSLLKFARQAVTSVLACAKTKDWQPMNALLRFSLDLDGAFLQQAKAQLPMPALSMASEQVKALLQLVQEADKVVNKNLASLATCLARMQELASNCILDEVQAEVQRRTEERLDKVQTTGPDDTADLDLGDALSAAGEYGEEVKRKYKRFAAALIRQRQEATRSVTIDAALDTMQLGTNAISRKHADQLREAYNRYQTKFEDLIGKPPSAIPELVQAAQQHGRKLARDTSALKRELPVLLAYLSAIWSLFSRATIAKTTKSSHGIYKELHVIQILALFELVGLSQSQGWIAGFGAWCKSFVPNAAKSKLGGAFVQLQTGGGKSILLGFASVIYSLLGFDVACACYSAILSTRDYEDFKAFFELLAVSKHIQYSTLTHLARKALNASGDIRDALQTLIVTGKLSDGKPQSHTRPTILLVDEVDTLLSPVFLTEPYNPGTLVHDKDFTALMRAVWSNKALTAQQVQQLPEAQTLLQSYAHAKNLMLATFDLVVAGRAAIEKNQHPHSVDDQGRIVYKRQGLDENSADVVYGYETQFAYLMEEGRGRVPPEVCADHIGMLFTAGHFSFVKIIQTFDMISGVTGTVPEDTTLLSDRFNIERQCVMPSMYGDTRLVFDPVQITENMAQQHQTIADECHARSSGRAVIVFFPNSTALEAFQASAEFRGKLGGRDINIIDVGKPDIPHRIRQATRQNSITLATVPFGRGSDFTVLNRDIKSKGGVHVIQAFLSTEVAEQIQIQGRTAREDNPGSYRLVLCLPDLKSLLKEHCPDTIRSGSFSELPTALDQARRAVHAEFLNASFAALRQCEAAHVTSLKLRDELFAGRQGNPERALRYVQQYSSHAEYAEAADVLMVVDVSGSMTDYMEQARAFVRTIAREGFHLDSTASQHRMALFTFGTTATALGGEPLFTSDWAQLQQRVAQIAVNGATNYLPALKLVEQSLRDLKASDPARYNASRRIVLFQTDGSNSDRNQTRAITATARRIVDELDATLMAVLTGAGVSSSNVSYFVGRSGQFDSQDRTDGAALSKLILTVDDYDALVQRASGIAACATSM